MSIFAAAHVLWDENLSTGGPIGVDAAVQSLCTGQLRCSSTVRKVDVLTVECKSFDAFSELYADRFVLSLRNSRCRIGLAIGATSAMSDPRTMIVVNGAIGAGKVTDHLIDPIRRIRRLDCTMHHGRENIAITLRLLQPGRTATMTDEQLATNRTGGRLMIDLPIGMTNTGVKGKGEGQAERRLPSCETASRIAMSVMLC